MIALDTNILIWAIDPADERKFLLAQGLVFAAQDRADIVPVQVLGEFLAVISRKFPSRWAQADEIVQSIIASCQVPATGGEDLLEAIRLAQRYKLQYFDALIFAVAARAGATTLYSEDMQHGLTLGPLTVTNPFIETAGSTAPRG